jgi:hypothetical protein
MCVCVCVGAMWLCASVRACVRARLRACIRACSCACRRARASVCVGRECYTGLPPRAAAMAALRVLHKCARMSACACVRARLCAYMRVYVRAYVRLCMRVLASVRAHASLIVNRNSAAQPIPFTQQPTHPCHIGLHKVRLCWLQLPLPVPALVPPPKHMNPPLTRACSCVCSHDETGMPVLYPSRPSGRIRVCEGYFSEKEEKVQGAQGRRLLLGKGQECGKKT